MNLQDCQTMFAYNDWANDRLLACVAELGDGLWARDLGSSFSSVRDTFAHLAAAEWVWLRRWHGESPRLIPDWAHEPPAAQIGEALREVRRQRARFLASLRDSDLAAPVRFTFLSGAAGEQPLGGLVLHVVNHSTYHRGQIAAMLRQMGQTPASTDVYLFNQAAPLPAPPPLA